VIDTLNLFWDRTFPGTPQLAHHFRDNYSERWVRFHSLPESKRYAETEAEYKTILSRHNEVLSELIGTGRVVLVTTGYTGEEKPKGTPKRQSSELAKLDPKAQYWRTLALHEIQDDPDAPNYWHLFASDWNWKPGIFDSVLRLVADDTLINTFIFSTSGSWLYHPYDGGADVILPSRQARDIIREKHIQWLSSNPKGL